MYILIVKCYQLTIIQHLKNMIILQETMEMHGGNKIREFESFNGPILMTTNCIVPPKDRYKDRIYTTGAAGYRRMLST